MGFDDIVWDNEIKKKTIEILRPLIGCYDYEVWDDLEKMETGESGYNAYSLIYRQIHAINYAVMCGSCPHAPSPEALAQEILGSREEVLKLFLEEVDKDHPCVVKGNNLKKMGGKIREIHEETMCLLKNHENKRLKTYIEALRKENEKLKSGIDELFDNNATASKQIEELKEELQKSKNHRDHRLHNKMEKEIQELNKELEKLNKELQKLNKELQKIKRYYSHQGFDDGNVVKELKKLKEQNHSYTQVSKSLKEENEKWQEWIRQVLMMGSVGSLLIEAMMEQGFLEDTRPDGGDCIPILTNIK
jgi:FtsZ-binding cell division protein ZapB